MAYIQVEASVRTHKKFLKAGPAASWLWLCGMGYCQDGLTDGFIPFEALDYLGIKGATARKLKCTLVAVKLWDEAPGGWHVHDYLRHNKSAESIRHIKGARAAGGSRGGRPTHETFDETLKVTSKVNHTKNPSHLISATATPTTTPLVTRRRLDAAWEGEKGLYVPQRKHSDFVQIRNHSGAERELFSWYAEVAGAWIGSPGADMLKFWTARFDEKWPAPASIQPQTSRRPAWAPK